MVLPQEWDDKPLENDTVKLVEYQTGPELEAARA